LASLKEKKDPMLAYALWCLSLVGICGVQRMYLGQVGLGLVMLFTFGVCGIAQFLDLFLIPSAVRNCNDCIAGNKQVEGVGFGMQNVVDRPSVRPSPPSSPSKNVSQDDDLEFLLKQAERSVQRTEGISEDN
jgi:TM2 domain-containing membrane protein YozV